jgi:predicted nucleotidyltransferase
MVVPRSEIADVIIRYCSQLGEMGIRVERALLFGSYACGAEREGSDIDVLIVSSDFSALNARKRLEYLGTAAARLWQPIEALACTPEELAHAEPATLLEEIIRIGVRVA